MRLKTIAGAGALALALSACGGDEPKEVGMCGTEFREFHIELDDFMAGGESTDVLLSASQLEVLECAPPEGYASWREVRQDIRAIR